MYPAGTKRTVHITWSSRAVFVMASVGAAVGFSNFWQFPPLVFEYGGGAFLLVYFLFLVLLGMPLLAAQFIIGRLGRDAPDGAFRRVAMLVRARGPWWIVGAMAVLGGFLVFSYLSIIAGWTMAFGFRAAAGVFSGLTADGVTSIFTLLVNDPEKQIFWYTLFIVSIGGVASRGLRTGTELVVRYAVPLLYGLMLIMVLYAVASGGFAHAVESALMPDFTRLSWTGIAAAAGHAFFTLSLGSGAMLMYGAYLDRDAPIARMTWYVVALDTLAGLAAVLIADALLAAGGVDLAVGPALLFQALPLAFDHLPLGQAWLTVFFVMLVLAAWLSGIALFEPAVMWVIERFHWTRPRAVFFCALVAWGMGLVFTLSLHSWAFSFPFLGEIKKLGLFDVAQILTSRIMLPLVGIGSALLAGWVLRPEVAREQLHMRSPCAFDAWLWLVRIVIPITLVIVMFQLSKLYA